MNAYKVNSNGLPDPNYNDSTLFDTKEETPANGETYKTDPNNGYTGKIDPRLDHIVGRPGIDFLGWGIQEISWPRDPSNGGPFLNKKIMYQKEGVNDHRGDSQAENDNNFRKLRWAHILLWRAEAHAQTNSLTVALEMVNMIRNRAKNTTIVDVARASQYTCEPYTTFGNKEAAMEAIQVETRLEFALDGMRFFDLVRWGIASNVMNKYLTEEAPRKSYLVNTSFQDKHIYWPVPQDQIDFSRDAEGNNTLIQVVTGWKN